MTMVTWTYSSYVARYFNIHYTTRHYTSQYASVLMHVRVLTGHVQCLTELYYTDLCRLQIIRMTLLYYFSMTLHLFDYKRNCESIHLFIYMYVYISESTFDSIFMCLTHTFADTCTSKYVQYLSLVSCIIVLIHRFCRISITAATMSCLHGSPVT